MGRRGGRIFPRGILLEAILISNLAESVIMTNRLRVRLHVTERKPHPGMKKILFTREFHPGMKRVEFHPGMKFNLKENLPLSMKTYNKTYHLSLIC